MIHRKSKFSLNRRLLAVAALVAVPLVAPLQAFADEGRLTVTGSASVSLSPDIARVTLGVSTQESTAAAALAQNSTAMRAVLDQLKAAGLAEKDIQTSGLTVGPEWVHPQDGTPPKVSGYSASNLVTVKVSDLANLGKVLDAVVKDGANQLNGISFDLENPKPVMEEARKAAISEARAKATLMAEAAGVKLGKIIDISEGNTYGGRPELRMVMAVGADAVPISQGEIDFSASVTLVYEID